ncbi:hypothetical protein ACP70R_042592 [Stipagrostis hirtigluma subsp. patula]
MCRATFCLWQDPLEAGPTSAFQINVMSLAVMQPTEGGATTSSASDAADGGKISDAAGEQAELPLHLTEEVLRCISPLASARLATVCKSWAATVAARLARPSPHLFVCTSPDKDSDRRGVIFSVRLDAAGGAVGRARSPWAAIPGRVRSVETNGLRCIGATPSGRLAFASTLSRGAVVVNPVTGASQSIDVGMARWYVQDNAVAVGGSDSFFFVDANVLVLWRRADVDGEGCSKWTAVEAAAHQTMADIVSAASCNGCIYMLHADGCMSVIDAAAPPPLRREKLPVASPIEQQFITPCLNPFREGHLLESDGEVLFVRPLLDHAEKDEFVFCGHHREFLSIVGFEVYRLDVEDQRWTSVKALTGDRALFVSPQSSFAVRASETAGCRRNCIYFVGKQRFCSSCNGDAGNTWGVYSMEDREVLFEDAVTKPGKCSAALWFLPMVENRGQWDLAARL